MVISSIHNCDKHINCLAWYMPLMTNFCIPYTEPIAPLVNLVCKARFTQDKNSHLYRSLLLFLLFATLVWNITFFNTFLRFLLYFFFFWSLRINSRFSLFFLLLLCYLGGAFGKGHTVSGTKSWMIELEVDGPGLFGWITIEADGDGTFSLISTGLGN